VARKKKEEVSLRNWGEGNVTTKRGSSRLYYDFRYLGERVEISTGLSDTPDNRRKAMAWLIRQRERIEEGTFRFAEAFPGASEEKKAHFSRLEGSINLSKPNHILFGDYVSRWYREVWEHHPSASKKVDEKSAIDYWITPFFGNKTFFEISSVVMGDFIRSLKHREGNKAGQPLSRKRVANILLPLRSIWRDACDEYRWDLPDPFKNVPKQLPRDETVDECMEVVTEGEMQRIEDTRDALRFDEFMAYLGHMDPWYRPVAELWILTGMIPSEMAGLTRLHIKDGYLFVRRSVSRGVEKAGGKTTYRRREIRITATIQRVVDELLARTDGKRLVTLKSGKPLTPTEFYDAWVKAEKKAGLRHRRPYCLRHSFAAWSLAIGIDMNRLAWMMGHGSKKMVYEVYGRYVEKLGDDKEKILAYFGQDFVAEETKKAA
jgi:integrase